MLVIFIIIFLIESDNSDDEEFAETPKQENEIAKSNSRESLKKEECDEKRGHSNNTSQFSTPHAHPPNHGRPQTFFLGRAKFSSWWGQKLTICLKRPQKDTLFSHKK